MDQRLQELYRDARARPDDVQARVRLFREAQRAGLPLDHAICAFALEPWENLVIESVDKALAVIRGDRSYLSDEDDSFRHFYDLYHENFELLGPRTRTNAASVYGRACEDYIRRFNSSYGIPMFRTIAARLSYDFERAFSVFFVWESEINTPRPLTVAQNAVAFLDPEYERYASPPTRIGREGVEHMIVSPVIPDGFGARGRQTGVEIVRREIAIPPFSIDGPSIDHCYECQRNMHCVAHTRTAFSIQVSVRRGTAPMS